MKKTTLVLLLIVGFLFNVNAQEKSGLLIDTIIPAPSLKGNLLQTPTEQPITVYLPPSYNDSEKKYPVVYYLPGYGVLNTYYTEYGIYQGYLLKNSMDKLIKDAKIKDLIVVVPNAVNVFAGHFYVNSPVSGNWEDFITKDLINFVDKTYRTIPKSESRGISGHSMGGFGALNLAMRHPNIFGITYAITPLLFDEKGIYKHPALTVEKYINRFLDKREELSKMPEYKALANLLYYGFQNQIVLEDYRTSFCYAYGTAFSPNPNINPPYIDYLYERKNGELTKNKKNWENYESGIGNLEKKVTKFKKNLLSLNAIYIDYGENDHYKWIPEGCICFSELLNKNNIKHKLSGFNGGHYDKLRKRLEEFMFPTFSQKLKF